MALMLTFVLAFSTFATSSGANAASHADLHDITTMVAGADQPGAGHTLCHKATSCEAPAMLQRWQRATFTGRPSRLGIVLRGPVTLAAAPETDLPPPKA